ncbi:MAG: hypothetical protein WCL39_07845 [Armatimonadota bacterium]
MDGVWFGYGGRMSCNGVMAQTDPNQEIPTVRSAPAGVQLTAVSLRPALTPRARERMMLA